MKLAITLLIALFMLTGAAAASTVRICDDIKEWPPYSYFPRHNGRVDTSTLNGAMIEFIDEVFRLVEMEYSITAMPWKRCLYEVANFDRSRKYEIAIEGTLNEERLRDYYVTAYIYTTTGGYWYSTKKYPDGPRVRGPDDLKSYNLCGIRGYNYTGYGISPDSISSSPPDYPAAFAMLALGRCDLFLSNIPTVLGKVKLGELAIPAHVVGQKVPNLTSGTFHIFIAKSSPRAQQLLSDINQAIHVLNFRGVTDRIFLKYLPTCGRHC